jgi:hypothetical protein
MTMFLGIRCLGEDHFCPQTEVESHSRLTAHCSFLLDRSTQDLFGIVFTHYALFFVPIALLRSNNGASSSMGLPC